jgi:phosphoglycolate phosphatase-like HAD superfamily hydrolase
VDVPEQEKAAARAQAPARALIVDWGGVLTTPVREAIAEWIMLDRIDGDHYRTLARSWVGGAYTAYTSRASASGDGPGDRAGDGTGDGAGGSGGRAGDRAGDGARAEVRDGAGAALIHRLEEGTLAPAEFERILAARLRTTDGSEVAAAGLLARMFAGFRPVTEMYEVVRRARAAGIRTCLLSNSWGNSYPRESFAELFDAVVISAEVGMRKPGAEIFHHALDLIAMEPAASVFVDDIAQNVRAAEALGMTGLHHQEVPATARRLEGLLGIRLV